MGNFGDKVLKDSILAVRDVDRPLRDREMLLKCRNKDFYSVLAAANEGNGKRERNESKKKVQLEGSADYFCSVSGFN